MTRLLLLALLGCNTGPGTTDAQDVAADFAGPAGRRWLMAPTTQPDDTRLMIHNLGETWEVRHGDRWRDATPIATWPISLQDGLSVDGVRLLPDPITSGAEEGDLSVTSVGEVEVWYGTFDRAVTVECATSPWHGTHAFAEGFGPIHLDWHGTAAGIGGTAWDLVGYEDIAAQ